MADFLLVLIAAVVVGAIGFGVSLLITGDDPGIEAHEPDGRAVPLPSSRPLMEGDVNQLRFDTVVRGYRMNQVDAALRRAGYDIGYKEELIQVLEAEIKALREGRQEDADALRDARLAAAAGANAETPAAPKISEVTETGSDIQVTEISDADEADEKPPSDTAWGSSADDSWGRPSPVVK
ncbi:DivIVA domain-containing protein [Dactylosporangium sp. CA-233914]|uniref:DivIVA domain-containing protein n=1 Tax=Dactylosporangium sp. CA-233914 TaxID=3239934 RepID=UPI003D8CB7FD